MSLLIFPAVTPTAKEYYGQARAMGQVVVAASSVLADENAAYYETWAFLPTIYDPHFKERFLALVDAHQITSLHLPVVVVHAFMKQFIDTHGLDLTIVNESPVQYQRGLLERTLEDAHSWFEFVQHLTAHGSDLSVFEVAALMRQSMQVYGESYELKLAAIMGCFHSVPKGDVVEVGSLMGRTTALLRLLADRYQTGVVLSVDPWGHSAPMQKNSDKILRDIVLDWGEETLSRGFHLNMLGFGVRDFAHLEMPSAEGHDQYQSGAEIRYHEFEPIRLSGQIALLHIDANHDYEGVKQDWQLWGQHLMPGGWLVLDDYLWMHGNGPMRVGNDLIAVNHGRIAQMYVCGRALFCAVRSKPAIGCLYPLRMNSPENDCRYDAPALEGEL